MTLCDLKCIFSTILMYFHFFTFIFWGSCWDDLRDYFRWNERKLKEMADESGTTAFQQRAGRLAKWREMAQQAADEHQPKIKIPDGIEFLDSKCFAMLGWSWMIYLDVLWNHVKTFQSLLFFSDHCVAAQIFSLFQFSRVFHIRRLLSILSVFFSPFHSESEFYSESILIRIRSILFFSICSILVWSFL